MKTNEVIIAPILTEKATNMAKNSVYMFEVNLKSAKPQIKNVLEKIYSVKVGGIRVMMRKGKVRRIGRSMKTKKLRDRKIAFVKLISGKIDIFPQA